MSLLLAVLCLTATARPAAAQSLRTPFDARVDALPGRVLLSRAPQELVDPARQRAARTITDLRQGVFFGWAGAQIWMFAWYWRSGRAARMRDVLRRRIRSRFGYRAAFGAVLGTIAPLAGLPFAFVSYRIGFNVGLTEQRIGGWFVSFAVGLAADALCAAIAVAVVLELVDRTRLWYLAFLAMLLAATVEVVGVDAAVFLPLRARVTPVDRPGAAAPVLVERASDRTRTLTAYTAGIGTFTRIVLGDVLLASATGPEVAFAVERENAHVRHDDDLKLTLVATLLFVVAVALAVLISDLIGFRRDDDAVSRLALVGAFIGGAALVMFPLYNAYARGIGFRADEDARQAVGDAAPAVRLLVRSADRDLTPLCYRRSSSWYFASDPALGSRIASLRRSEDPCPPSPAIR